MVNKELDEDKIVIVEMNKRTYHGICGEKANIGLNPNDFFKLLGERFIE